MSTINGGGHLLFQEAVALAASIFRGGSFKTATSENDIFLEADVLSSSSPKIDFQKRTHYKARFGKIKTQL